MKDGLSHVLFASLAATLFAVSQVVLHIHASREQARIRRAEEDAANGIHRDIF